MANLFDNLNSQQQDALYYFETDITANLGNLVNYCPDASLDAGKIHMRRDWGLP